MIAAAALIAAAAPTVTVPAVRAEMRALAGRTVAVRGWLVVCDDMYGCAIAARPLRDTSDRPISMARFRQLRARELSIAYPDAALYPQLERLVGREIVLTARVRGGLPNADDGALVPIAVRAARP